MSELIKSGPTPSQPKTNGGFPAYWNNYFRRTQLVLGWWGLLLIGGSVLHANFVVAWSPAVMLPIWLGITVLGMMGAYRLAPPILPSGMLFVWTSLVVGALTLTWLILFPLGGAGHEYIASLWHVAFALGYVIAGYFMERRLWWLAGWEMLVALFLLLSGLEIIEPPDELYSPIIVLGLYSGVPLLLAALPWWKPRNSL